MFLLVWALGSFLRVRVRSEQIFFNSNLRFLCASDDRNGADIERLTLLIVSFA
jgi:hypothetical protein